MYPKEHQYNITPNSQTPAFRDIILVFILSSVIFVFLGVIVQHVNLLIGLIISELAFIVAPSMCYTIWAGYNFPRTFHISPIRIKTAILSIITTGAAFVLVGIIATLQEVLLPRSQDYQEIWETVLHEFHQVPLFMTLLVVAVLPGICEELLFRGFLLHGMRKKLSNHTAIIFVGILFGAFHLDPYRFLPVTLLGILFGYMVVKTGSIVTGMIAHCTNNTIAVLISYVVYLAKSRGLEIPQSSPEQIYTLETFISLIPIAVIALIVFFLGFRALPTNPLKDEPDGNIELVFDMDGRHMDENAKDPENRFQALPTTPLKDEPDGNVELIFDMDDIHTDENDEDPENLIS